MKINYFIYKLYKYNNRRIRRLIINFLMRFEKENTSITLRLIFEKYHNVKIGLYTGGGCFNPGQFDRYTTIGKFCSISRTATVLNRNHPMTNKSTQAFFFNPEYGFVDKDEIPYTPLDIGNDVWIGHNAIIMPSVEKIGDGSIIAAGAVVNKNIPPYAVVVGNPARVVRYRFPKEIIDALLNEKWWDYPIDKIKENINDFITPLGNTDGNL